MKKIAVMLPVGYRGGSLRAAKNIAKSIAFQAHEQGSNIQVVFSYVKEGKYNLYTDFDDLLKFNCVLRETEWNIYSREELRAAASLINIDASLLEYPSYCLPSDGANDFYDCDLWLIISDRLPAPLFPLKKYGFVVYDYIQRYVPEIFGDNDQAWDTQVSNLISSVRKAAKVFVTTPSTRQDIISYAGVHPSRVKLLDMEFQPLEAGNIKIDSGIPENYIIWTTNTTHHKNHIIAFDAIEMYIQEFGGAFSFIVTGPWTEYFDPKNEFSTDDPVMQAHQVKYIRGKLKRNLFLAKRIHVMGNVSDRIYAQLLKNAKFLLHPTLYDNGTFAVMEAAYLGVPSLSARYPAMEYINEKFNLNLQFFNPHNHKEMAEALLNMETATDLIALPKQSDLLLHDWKTLSPQIYLAILEIF